MSLADKERIGENDRVLVVIPNQYMFDQVIWYHTKYPEGIWDAIIIPYAFTNDVAQSLMQNLYEKCIESHLFSEVYLYKGKMIDFPLIRRMLKMCKYTFLYLLNTREKADEKKIKKITGRNDYKKVIIHSRCNDFEIVAVNAVRNGIIVCMEDGLADYFPKYRIYETRFPSQIFAALFAKMNILNLSGFGQQFGLKYDNRIIKYCSLPDKMRYRDFKEIKQLFEADNKDNAIVKGQTEKILQGKYGLIVFSAPFTERFKAEYIYPTIHTWLKSNYADKKILIKPHPRESYLFQWDDLDIDVADSSFSGENILDLYPNIPILFTLTSTILLKACRTKRDFKILIFNLIKSKRYQSQIEFDSQLLGIENNNFIYI